MAKNYFAKIGVTILAAVQLVAVGWYIHHDLAQAYVRYGPAAQLNVGDIKSSHILDGTIVAADMANYLSLLLASSTIGSLTATSSVSLPTGSITSAMVGDNTIVDADISSTAAINLQKLATSSATHFVTDGAQTIAGIKTFSDIPVLPASDPTADNQAARKSYVDNSGGTIAMTGTTGANIAANVAVAMATSTVAAVNAQSASATTEGVCFGKATLCDTAGQSFKENMMYLTHIDVSLNKTGTPTDNVILKLCVSGATDPVCTSEVASTTISGAGLSTSYATTTWTLYPGVLLGQNVRYWIVASRSGALSDANYYNIERDNAANNYANGAAAYALSGSWTHQSTWDIKFKMTDTGITQGYIYTGNGSSWTTANSIIGISNATYATSSQAKIAQWGPRTVFSGLTPLANYFVGNYAGVIQSSAGTESYVIGRAVGTTTMFIKPAGI